MIPKRKASLHGLSRQYERKCKLHDILTRKYKETGGKLRHRLLRTHASKDKQVKNLTGVNYSRNI